MVLLSAPHPLYFLSLLSSSSIPSLILPRTGRRPRPLNKYHKRMMKKYQSESETGFVRDESEQRVLGISSLSIGGGALSFPLSRERGSFAMPGKGRKCCFFLLSRHPASSVPLAPLTLSFPSSFDRVCWFLVIIVV